MDTSFQETLNALINCSLETGVPKEIVIRSLANALAELIIESELVRV